MHRPTVEVYAARASAWEAARRPNLTEARRFARSLAATDRPVLDLGCGPGWTLPALPGPKVALDAAWPFVARLHRHDPNAPGVQADLAALPFRRHSLGAAWADRSLVHLARSDVPLALWDLHRALRPGAPVGLRLFEGDLEHDVVPDDDFPGRRFSAWHADALTEVLEGAGFVDAEVRRRRPRGGDRILEVTAVRGRTLADTVGPSMRLLCVGLNPSVLAADVGVGFARPGNRFWPAALAAGIVSRDRDPLHALRTHGIGMTDLVKRATPRADELRRDEYVHGVERLDRLCGWLAPAAVCIVGLAGWRAAVDRRATPGWQERRLGGRPTYVMPNPSGLNAHDTVESLAAHLRAASAPSPSP